MSKKQKILLWVSLAIFAIPEILWSPIVNTINLPFSSNKIGLLDNNFLFQGKNEDLTQILLIQFIAILSSTILFGLFNKSIKNRKLFWGIITLFIFLTIFTYLTYDTSISYNPKLAI